MALIDEFETNGVDPSSFANPRQKFSHVTKVRPWSLSISGSPATALDAALPGVDEKGRALVVMTTSENVVSYRYEARARALRMVHGRRAAGLRRTRPGLPAGHARVCTGSA